MDRRLRELDRILQTNPEDEETARQLASLALRAGGNVYADYILKRGLDNRAAAILWENKFPHGHKEPGMIEIISKTRDYKTLNALHQERHSGNFFIPDVSNRLLDEIVKLDRDEVLKHLLHDPDLDVRERLASYYARKISLGDYSAFRILQERNLAAGMPPLRISFGELEDGQSSLLKGEIIVAFETQDLLNAFNLGRLDDIDDFNAFPTEDDVAAILDLDKDFGDEDYPAWGSHQGYLDKDNNPISEEAMMDLLGAVADAIESGVQAGHFRAISSALETILDEFSNENYDYYYEDEDIDEEGHLSGKAQGILKYNVAYDTTTIKANTDIVHLIINNLSYLEISPLEDSFIEDFVSNNLVEAIKRYYRSSGRSLPTVYNDHNSDLNRELLNETVKGIEEQFSLRLL